jgi:hypothetical protein
MPQGQEQGKGHGSCDRLSVNGHRAINPTHHEIHIEVASHQPSDRVFFGEGESGIILHYREKSGLAGERINLFLDIDVHATPLSMIAFTIARCLVSWSTDVGSP